MARYSGVIGYAEQGEFIDGVWENQSIVEKHYYGDVNRINRRLQNESNVLPNLSVGNTISVVADAYAYQHFHNIIYVEWQGTKWVVTSVDVERPRLTLSLGGVYNGPQS